MMRLVCSFRAVAAALALVGMLIGNDSAQAQLRQRCCTSVSYYKSYAPAYGSSDWRSELLRIAAAQKDADEYREALDRLGLSGVFRSQANAYGAQAGLLNSSQAQSYAPQGTTYYGYSSQQTFGNVDMAQLYNQAARLTDQAQQLAGQAHTDFSGLVQQEGEGRNRAAEIAASGQAVTSTIHAAAEALKAAKPPAAQSVTRTFQFQATHNPATGQTSVTPLQSASVTMGTSSVRRGAAEQVLATKCLACHGGGKSVKAGLDLRGWSSFDAAKKKAILARTIDPDPQRRMPLATDGGPGVHLTPDEVHAIALDVPEN